MEWERTQKQLLRADRLVAQAEGCLAEARLAIHGARYSGSCTIGAEQALKALETMLEDGIVKRARLKDKLRLLTH